MSLLDGNDETMFVAAPLDDLLDELDPDVASWLLLWQDEVVDPIDEPIATAHVASAVAAARADRPLPFVPGGSRRRHARTLAKVAVGATASFAAMTGLAAASVLPAPAARGVVFVADVLGVPVPQAITRSADTTTSEPAVAASEGSTTATVGGVPVTAPVATVGTTEPAPEAPAAAPTTTAPLSPMTTTTVAHAVTVPPPVACATGPVVTSTGSPPAGGSTSTTTTAPVSAAPAPATCTPSESPAPSGGGDDNATASGTDGETGTSTTTTTAPADDGDAEASGSTTTTSTPASTTTTAPADDGAATASSDLGSTAP